MSASEQKEASAPETPADPGAAGRSEEQPGTAESPRGQQEACCRSAAPEGSQDGGEQSSRPDPPPPGPRQGRAGESPFRPAGPAPPYYGPYGYAPPPRPPQRSSSSWAPWIGAGCLGFLPWALLFFILLGQAGTFGRSPIGRGERIGMIFVEGPIMGGRGSAGLLGFASGSDDIVRQLDRARRDSSIKAVVLRINSPGGSAAASQEIFSEVMKLRAAGKPVIASMADVAASGGYYVAAGADIIMANGSTLTGSIGVVMEMLSLEGLLDKVGVDMETIKSGEFKDIGSSTRPMTPKERRILQTLLDDVYEQFVSAVTEGRTDLSPAQVRQLADGRIFTGKQAMELGLVDALGNVQDAIALAAREAGIVGRPIVVEMGTRSFLDLLAGSEPSYNGRFVLPGGRTDEERLVRALRRLIPERPLPR